MTAGMADGWMPAGLTLGDCSHSGGRAHGCTAQHGQCGRHSKDLSSSHPPLDHRWSAPSHAMAQRRPGAEESGNQPRMHRSTSGGKLATSEQSRSPPLRKTCSEPHLGQGSLVGGDGCDYLAALKGLRGAVVPTHHSRPSRRKRLPGASDCKDSSLSSPPEDVSLEKKGFFGSLVALAGRSPPKSPPKPGIPPVLPGETPQSRHMRRTLQYKGARLAAHALDSANGVSPPESSGSPPQAAQEHIHGGNGYSDPADRQEAKSSTDWRSSEWQRALREVQTNTQSNSASAVPVAVSSSMSVQCEIASSGLKVAHIRYMPRHVSRVLMQSCVRAV